MISWAMSSLICCSCRKANAVGEARGVKIKVVAHEVTYGRACTAHLPIDKLVAALAAKMRG